MFTNDARGHGFWKLVLLGTWLVAGCSGDRSKATELEAASQALTAEAPSMHYVVVTFGEPVGAAAAVPENYLIRDSSGGLLEVTGATVSSTGTQVTLATATQQPTDYELALVSDLGIGSAGFVGSSQDEPFLESALALSDTTLQLTFSERMDRQLANMASFYRLQDPDGDQDVDIEVVSAVLQDDLRSVILTTTPQENRLYTVRAANVKSRFSCDDGDVAPLRADESALACAPVVRPVTDSGEQLRISLTARSGVNRLAPLDPEAAGTVGTVKPANSGLGVGSTTCSGNPCATFNGSGGHEELTLNLDVPARADTLVLGLNGLNNDIVIFLSSTAAAGFDRTVTTTEIETRGVGDGVEVYFNQFTSLPPDLMIDRVRVRVTAGSMCIDSICVADGRTIDPTRSVANFWGIPTDDSTAPRLVRAISTSPTTVLATFDEPLDSEAADPTHYNIGPNLAVTAAVQTEYQTQVLLTTTLQSAGTEYTLEVAGVRDRARNLIDPAADTASFDGISSQLFLETAISLNATQLLLTFSEPMDTASLENTANYSITDPDGSVDADVDIAIVSAAASANGRSVVLTTTPQSNILYQIVATNLRGENGDFFIDPTRNTATFQGIPPLDDAAPRVLSAVSVNDESVLVTFSEPLRIESANAANFNISPELTVREAALTAREDQIFLTTSPQLADVLYTVTVTAVADKLGNVIDAANTATFTFDGGPETTGAGSAPRVVGAASTSNTTVVVTFSKAMSDDAINPSNYVIVQQYVNSEVGYLGVVDAEFLGDDRTAVQLTTRVQNEVTYLLAATNVRDRSGNQIAAREVSAGILIDPRTASFAGTPWSACDPDDDDCVDESDTDGEGLQDNTEQRGWVVYVRRVNGQILERQVTSNPDLEDTDGDGLDDALERLIGSDPRDADTDDDLLVDYEEYNVVYSDTNSQDTDHDGADDYLEVEYFKTNALVADSDGDGFDDGDELFSIHRDPRIADLPSHAITVGSVSLTLDQRFTYVDQDGQTRSQNSSTSSALTNETRQGESGLNQTVGRWALGVETGVDTCQSDTKCTFLDRLFFKLNVGGGQEFTTANTTTSERNTTRAFNEALEAGSALSTASQVQRDVVGASVLVDLSFQNTSDVAITLSNVEVRASTTDPNDPRGLVPLATLLPQSTLASGQPQNLHLGPGQTLGPIVFASRDVFPAVVEDLMRAPRGIIFNVANFDMVTGDGRNFADELQSVRQRTVGVRIDKGDGKAEQINVIAAGVLNRARDDFRCAEVGSRAGRLCSTDDDCADSAPCEGGKVVGGFSQFGGTGGETPLPLDFVLSDSLGMTRTQPPMILAGGTVAGTAAQGDDVQVVALGAAVAVNALVVAPGRNGVLETTPAGTDYASQGLRILAGDNGIVESQASGDDIQVLAYNPTPDPDVDDFFAPDDVVIAAGPNNVLDTVPDAESDDVLVGPDGIRAGSDGAVQSVARGDDVQLIPFGTTGVPPEAVAVSAGADGLLQTRVAVSDVIDLITGYEVTRTCSSDTPSRILAGQDGQADSTAEDGVCVVAYAPHFPGQECTSHAQCGVDGATGNSGRCRSDVQTSAVGATGLSPNAVVISPNGTLDPAAASFLESVPADDDVYVGPGIACTTNADCTVGAAAGTCDGQERLVRIDERRNGQFRRAWVALLSDGTQLETNFSALTVRAGDEIELAFLQDVDRDGLVANEEFLHGSSDFRKDTDDDGLGDFSEIRIGWEVGVVGEPLRRTLPDPRLSDSDGDGLSDLEEQDLRVTRCACDADGPKSLLGSGNLLRGAAGTESARPCTSNGAGQCGGGACLDAVDCPEGGPCSLCPTDVTAFRTDARLQDTDSDRISDTEESYGYLTGAGIVDPDGTDATKVLVLADDDLDVDTLACPDNHCIENPAQHCQTDADCESHVCVHDVPCDDVQVVPYGTGVRDPNTVVAIVDVVGPAPRFGAGDALAVVGAATAQSTIGGDDLLVVAQSQSVLDANDATKCEDGGDFAFCAAIKPGPDGAITSVRGGDDALVPGGSGQRRETSDPLNADTDMDLVGDGFERLLGSSPNRPGDAAFGGDMDQDGLTDSVERAGWFVVIDGVSSSPTDYESNPRLPDTDFDGLPDYAERYLPCSDDAQAICPTNPTEMDSDGDGLSDLDELSTAQLDRLAVLSEIFPGFELNAEDSAVLGTDPTSTDADGDGLLDNQELYVGWQVVRHDGTVEHVYSDPSNPDTDADGLSDGDESEAHTDPHDPDTDGDGRRDGQEALIGSEPLRPDLGVTISFTALELDPPDGENPMEWRWGFFVQKPGGDFPGEEVSNHFDCQRYDTCYCITEEPDRTIPLNKSISIDLAPGEAFVLSGMIRETTENHFWACPDGATSVYESAHDGDRVMSFIETPISYEDLENGRFLTRHIRMSSNDDDSNTATAVFIEISVNCAGSGRGICRTGSLCATDDDCETGHCDPEETGSDTQRCANYCGNGADDDPAEACDDGNTAQCGTCNSSCSAELTFPGCAGGTGCREDDDCASGTCAAVVCSGSDCPATGRACTTECGNGWVEAPEQCDDGNLDACGTCNAGCTARQGTVMGCPLATGCRSGFDCASGVCSEGVCRAACGNGITESGEVCDDGNSDACGSCTADCGMVDTTPAGCATGAGCKAGTDCASGVCSALTGTCT